MKTSRIQTFVDCMYNYFIFSTLRQLQSIVHGGLGLVVHGGLGQVVEHVELGRVVHGGLGLVVHGGYIYTKYADYLMNTYHFARFKIK